MTQQEKNRKIKQMVNSYKVSLIIINAEKIGIFHCLTEEAKILGEIAKELKLTIEKIEPILNALVCYGIVEKNERGYYIDAYKEQLLGNLPNNQLGYISFADSIMQQWNNMDLIIKEERKAEDNFRKITQEETKKFMEGMQVNAIPQAEYIAGNYNFKGHHILDIGAGAGTYLKTIAKKDITVTGEMLDLPAIANKLKEHIQIEGLQDRILVEEGNYRRGLPKGSFNDIFLFAVVHQENEENLRRLLQQAYERLKVGGTIYITSFFLNKDKISPEFAVQFAIEMLVMSDGGKVYTHEEIQNQLQEVGFKDCKRIDDLPSPATLYIAKK